MASSNQAFSETPPSTSTFSDVKSSSSPGKKRSPSPEQCCSICLGPYRDKSFTDSCFHTFCFSCLQEWAKVKPVCPLCKSSFNSIIHNIRSNEDYDRIYLSGPNATTDEETRRFRYATTLTHERRFLLEARRMRQFARDARREERRRREEAALSRRQLIYSAGLRVLHMGSNEYTRFRDISPQFFSANPAVTHRLVPWLRRELSVLFNNQEENVTFMTHYILSLVTAVDIQSEEFHMNLRPFLHDTVEHFVHEFASFARSPYDMTTYDQMSQYDFSGDIPGRFPPRRPNQSLLASLQEQGNDSDENSVVLLSDHESEPMVISDDNASVHEVEIISNTEDHEEHAVEPVEESSESESSESSEDSENSESSESSVESVRLPDEQEVFTLSDNSPSLNQEQPPLPFDPDRPGPSGLQSAATAIPVKEEPPDFHDSEHSDIECIAIYEGSRELTPEVLSSESETERIAIEEAERRWLEERARRKKEKEKRKQAKASSQSNNNSTNPRTTASRQTLSRSPHRSRRRWRRSASSSPERLHHRFHRSRSRDSSTRRRRSKSRTKGFFSHRSRSRSETPQPKSWRERFGYISLSPSPPRVVPSSSSRKKKRSRSRDRKDNSRSTGGASHRRRSKPKEKSPPRKRSSRSKSRKSRSRSKERHSHVKNHLKHKKSKKHSKKRSRSRSRRR